MFNQEQYKDYQSLLQDLRSSDSLSEEQLLRFHNSCTSLEGSTQNLNEKVAICFTQAEVCVRLALYFIDQQKDKEATYYYGIAFEVCDLSEKYINQLEEQQQEINENLLKESNIYGLTTSKNCKEKIFDLICKPLDELIERNHLMSQREQCVINARPKGP